MRVFLPADPFIHIRMFSDFLLKKYVTGKLSQPPMLHSLNTAAGKHNERLTGKWGSEKRPPSSALVKIKPTKFSSRKPDSYETNEKQVTRWGSTEQGRFIRSTYGRPKRQGQPRRRPVSLLSRMTTARVPEVCPWVLDL